VIAAIGMWALSGMSPTGAATFAVDDSGSAPGSASTAMHWSSNTPGSRWGNQIQGATLVSVRLRLTPWLNRYGRIYLALPPQGWGSVTAEWTTRGLLLPGSLAAGSRTLVYQGLIRNAFVEDTLTLTLRADGRRVSAPQALQFHFEIDLNS
jgi:hypothetical protein